MRTLGLLALLAAPVLAEGQTRLGGLVRWFLEEKSPARQEDLLETIRRLTGDDPARVAAAIRAGEHLARPSRPQFRRGGPHPDFPAARARIRDVAECAGDFARLHLPKDYVATRSYPLMLDLGGLNVVPEDAVVVQIDPLANVQAAAGAVAAEALVLSVLAHAIDVVNVDPDRVFLRGQGPMAHLAGYIAFHNPDRFAGVVGAQGFWEGAAVLQPHADLFAVLAIERRKGDKWLRRFMQSLATTNEAHVLLRAPSDPAEDRTLLPAIDRWWRKRRRVRAPAEIELRCSRKSGTRAHWVRVAPRGRSERDRPKLGRQWEHREMVQAAEFHVRIDSADGNLLHVTAKNVTAFEVWADPEMFDPLRPLSVKVNGVPVGAKPIDLNIAHLLEDYRDRRDPGLLYACRLTFPAR